MTVFSRPITISRRGHAGFSLLEVILATALLMGAAIVLAELANIGRAHARSAEELAAAQLACQTKLNEMLCGAASVATIEEQPLDELPGWVLSVDTKSVEQAGVVALHVTVAQATDEPNAPPGKQFTLVRWIRNPAAASSDVFLTQPWSESHPNQGPSP